MSFTRTIEDFICEHCGSGVIGNGYTDHCPVCLWSKHVDVDPGDRAATCGGMMEPIGLEGSSPRYDIAYRCTRCGLERRNAAVEADSHDAIVALAARAAKRR